MVHEVHTQIRGAVYVPRYHRKDMISYVVGDSVDNVGIYIFSSMKSSLPTENVFRKCNRGYCCIVSSSFIECDRRRRNDATVTVCYSCTEKKTLVSLKIYEQTVGFPAYSCFRSNQKITSREEYFLLERIFS